jgi:siroheme synthase
MGLGRSAAIACRLIDRGWRRGTPAAVVVDATRPEQQVWRGTLDQLAEDAVAIEGNGAGTIVIGDVVTIGLQQANRSPERLELQSSLGGQHVSRG